MVRARKRVRAMGPGCARGVGRRGVRLVSRRRACGGGADLHELALHHLLDHRREQLHHLHVAQPRQQHRRAREQKVAGEHRDLVAVDPVRGLGAAARVGEVDDVVVQQAGGVDHLGDLREPYLACTRRLTADGRGGREQHQSRAEALAGELEKMLCHARQHRMVAAHQLAQRSVQRLQMV